MYKDIWKELFNLDPEAEIAFDKKINELYTKILKDQLTMGIPCIFSKPQLQVKYERADCLV